MVACDMTLCFLLSVQDRGAMLPGEDCQQVNDVRAEKILVYPGFTSA